jgi:hypothetical protein
MQFLEANLTTILEGTGVESTLTSNNNTKLRLICKCLSSWIEEKLIEPSLLVKSPLFAYLFQIIHQIESELDLHEVVTTCLVNMLLMYPFNARVTDENKIF